MSNDRSIAVNIMTEAAKAVGKTRGPQHGSTEPSFTMIAELWSTHINHSTAVATDMEVSPQIHLTAWDVAQMMGLLKKARSVYGDKELTDHYADDIGYTSLAGMLATRDVQHTKVADVIHDAEVDLADLGRKESVEIPAFLKEKK